MPAAPYASLSDLQNSIQEYALTPVSTGIQSAKLQQAADRMDDYLNTQFELPLVPPYSTSLILCNCELALYLILKARGFSPKAGADRLVKEAYDDQIKWLEGIAADKIHPLVTDQSVGPHNPMGNEGTGFAVSVGKPCGSGVYTRGWVPGNLGNGGGPFGNGGGTGGGP